MTREEMQAKLNKVLAQMIAQCDDPQDRASLKEAKLFHNIEGLDMDIVVVAVPINSGSNRVHVAFTTDHFRKTTVLPEMSRR